MNGRAAIEAQMRQFDMWVLDLNRDDLTLNEAQIAIDRKIESLPIGETIGGLFADALFNNLMTSSEVQRERREKGEFEGLWTARRNYT